MKLFSSLFTKILAWFFLNLFLVLVVFFLFFLFQPEFDLYKMFGKQASDRIHAAGRLISHDLQKSSIAEWPDVLSRHGEIYGVDFLLYMDDGSCWFSREMAIPKSVKRRVNKAFQARVFRSSKNFQNRHGRMLMKGKKRHQNYEDAFPIQERPKEHGSMHDPKYGKKLNLRISTKNPTQYWAGTPIFIFAGPSSPPLSGILLAVSDSVTGNGLFFDPFPWIVVAVIVVLISIIMWIPLVRNITRPLARMTTVTEEIAKGRFDVKVPEKRGDEIGRLAKAINHMNSRLFGYVKGQKRFLGDVAHELGSPIARIQFGLGIMEQKATAEGRKRVADVLEDVDHMSNLVNELLSFSKAEIGNSKEVLQYSLLLPIVERVVQREQKTETAFVVTVDQTLTVWANPELLARALSNIIRNALNYAGDDDPIQIVAEPLKDVVMIRIRDNGPGVPEAYLDQLFEPFFRPDSSRTRDSGGVGLGLAIVKTCVEKCEGTVFAQNLVPRGFEVSITLKGSCG